MKSIISAYTDECLSKFEKNRSVKEQVVEISSFKSAFENAINEVEKTDAFSTMVDIISTKILKADLDRLSKKEERRLLKRKTKAISKPKVDLNNWRLRTAEHATKCFFRNTGFYWSLWSKGSVDILQIAEILNQYEQNPSSQKIRFYVFDGITLQHQKDEVNNISLPKGNIKKYNAKELTELFKLPQSHLHRDTNGDLAKRVSEWHALSVSKNEDYRGIGGLWIDENLVSVIGFHDIETKIYNKETEYIGPLFLFLGTDTNLAEEIVIRTNVFDTLPIYPVKRNNYLEWEPSSYNGELCPKRHVIEVGDAGNKIRKFYEIWQSVNSLEKNGFLIFPTAHYVRTILNKDRIYEEDPSLFVNLVTVTESLLNPGSRMELAYKTAIRGASLLTLNQEKRMKVFQALSEVYKLRSGIVHEGRFDFKRIENLISFRLFPLTRQIFIRYMAIILAGLSSELPNWVLPTPDDLNSSDRRLPAISRILDGMVLDPSLVTILDDYLEKNGILEDWWRHTDLGFR